MFNHIMNSIKKIASLKKKSNSVYLFNSNIIFINMSKLSGFIKTHISTVHTLITSKKYSEWSYNHTYALIFINSITIIIIVTELFIL